MSAARRFIIALAILLLITAAGTAGYVVIEGMSLIDALYMSVMTISTVGFGEVKPLSPVGRLFTIGLIVTGVGTALYVFTVGAELLIEGRLRDYLGKAAMERKIHQLENHVIVCGYGRFGKVVAEEVARNSMPLVVVERAPAIADELTRAGLPFVIGSALDNAVLEEVGIGKARAIVIATASDADNVYITLSAREKNPKISIHARGEGDGGLRRLKLAGADQVISAYQYGGYRVASTIVRPSVVDFIELFSSGRGEEVDLEEIRIPAGSRMVGKTVVEIEDVIGKRRIVALKRNEDPIQIIPDASSEILAGDLIVAIGNRAGLEALIKAE